MNAVRASVDKGIPVMAWGPGNMELVNDEKYNPMPEGCLIGGYDETDALYVNLYPGPERLPAGSVDEFGYSKITGGLKTTKGLFFPGEKLENVDPLDSWKAAVYFTPDLLAMPPAEGNLGGKPDGWSKSTGRSALSDKFVFGKAAFDL